MKALTINIETMLYYITCLRFDRELFAGLKCFITFPLDKAIFFLPPKRKGWCFISKKGSKRRNNLSNQILLDLNSTEQPWA